MARPQPGIFAQGTRSHYHLEFDLRPGAPIDAVVAALGGLREPSVTAGGSNIVVGFGADAVAAAASRRRARCARRLRGHRGRRPPGAGHAARSLGVDPRHGRRRRARRRPRRGRSCSRRSLDLAAEQPCFVYRDSRDLTGFIDGTENPPVEEAFEVALVPDGEPGARRCVRDRAEVGARPRRSSTRSRSRSRRARSGARSPTASSSTTSPTPRTSRAS